MGTQGLGVKQAKEQASGSAELSERAHKEIGLWLAATPPEGRNEQRLLAEVARTHGLAGRRGDRGWDVEATKRAFWRIAGQDWWRQFSPETLRAPARAQGFPLLHAALARQGEGEWPRPGPGHSASQVMGAQQAGAIAESDRRPTSAETDGKAAGLRPTPEWGEGAGAAGAGRQQQGGEGPLSAEEWQQTQIPMDSARNWLMAPARRDQYLRGKLSYLEQRPSHPEWAAFDPPRPPGREAAKDLPRGQNWFTWELRGRPDLSPLPPRRHDIKRLGEEEIGQAFPQTEVGLRDTGGGSLRVDPDWYGDNIVRIPNRWGIQDVRDKKDKNGKRIGVEYFTPKDFQCNRLVAPHLVAALDELDAKGLLYLAKTIESYNPRYERGGTNPSRHTYGIAFDFNQVEYPQLTHRAYQEAKKEGRLKDQDERLIAIMQKHGFFYGGDYQYGDDFPNIVRQNFDPMHFEYADPTVLMPQQGG